MKPEDLGRYILRKALQDKLKMDSQRASALAGGQDRPGIALAAEISAVLGIPAEAWVNGNPKLEMWKIVVAGEIRRAAGEPCNLTPMEPIPS